MKNLTTPQAILFGLGLIALAIVISSYSPNSVIKEARADANQVVRALYDISGNIRKYCGN